jgi:hypothetical protein
MSGMKETTETLLKRLALLKDIDPFNKKLLNDCHEQISALQSEVDRLIYHNNNLMNVIYQNQGEIENT